MSKITITNPTDELLHHALSDIRDSHSEDLAKTASRAAYFLKSGKGKKTFRSKSVTITVIK